MSKACETRPGVEGAVIQGLVCVCLSACVCVCVGGGEASGWARKGELASWNSLC